MCFFYVLFFSPVASALHSLEATFWAEEEHDPAGILVTAYGFMSFCRVPSSQTSAAIILPQVAMVVSGRAGDSKRAAAPSAEASDNSGATFILSEFAIPRSSTCGRIKSGYSKLRRIDAIIIFQYKGYFDVSASSIVRNPSAFLPTQNEFWRGDGRESDCGSIQR